MGIRRKSRFTAYGNPWVGKKWAALGTSVTSGAQYTTPLATLLGATVTNLGVSGASLSNGNGANGAIYPKIADIPIDADLVTLELINDFRLDVPLGVTGDTSQGTFYGALKSAITAILAVNTARVVVVLTPHPNTDTALTGNWVTPNNNGVRVGAFVRAISEVARSFGPNVRVIDVFSKSGVGGSNSAATTSDGIHLNTFGGNIFAQYVFSELIKFRNRDLAKVQTPQLSPASGSSTATVGLSCGTSGASIHYTTDGSTPTAASTLYTGSIALVADTTVKAIAIKAGLYNSDVATGSYTYASVANTFDPVGAGTTITLTNSNLTATASAGNWWTVRTAVKKSSGKWYGEVKIANVGSNNFCMFGLADSTTASPGSNFTNFANSGAWFLGNAFYKSGFTQGTNPVTGMPSRAVNDIIGIAVDIGAKKFWISHNGTFYNSQDPAAGTNAAGTWSGSYTDLCLAIAPYGGFSVIFQQTLNYSPPSGFSQWA